MSLNSYNSLQRHICQQEKNIIFHQPRHIIHRSHRSKSNIKFNILPCQRSLTCLQHKSPTRTFHPRRFKRLQRTLTFHPFKAPQHDQATRLHHQSTPICHQITHISSSNRIIQPKLHTIRNHNMIIRIMTNSKTVITINNTNGRRRRHRLIKYENCMELRNCIISPKWKKSLKTETHTRRMMIINS